MELGSLKIRGHKQSERPDSQLVSDETMDTPSDPSQVAPLFTPTSIPVLVESRPAGLFPPGSLSLSWQEKECCPVSSSASPLEKLGNTP